MVMTAYRAPEFAPTDEPPPPRPPARPTPEARELERVKELLRALRPDSPDPLCKPPPPETPSPTVRVRDPRDGWGGCPPGLDGPEFVDAGPGPLAAVVHVMDRLRALADDARAVCTWLRLHAELETLRGLYCDVGWAFRDAAQDAQWAKDLTARRDGSYHLGRTLVFAAAAAWGLPLG